MNKDLENTIRYNFNNALNKFNFANVYKVMEYLGWYWGGDEYAPSQTCMIEMVKELFETGIENYERESDYWVSSGGFTVRIFKTKDVAIEFILEDASSYE